MRPKVVMHTQISLDGCNNGFVDTGVYYAIAAGLNADMALFGSETAWTAAIEYPPETEKDFIKPAYDPGDKRAMCVVVDSRGRLRNLHVFRNSEYIKDFIILVSETTPKEYIEYLQKRSYDYIVAGSGHVDYKKALEELYEKYDCRVIRTDSGGVLTNVLLEQGLVDEVSLVVSPCLVGRGELNVFRTLSLPARLDLELVKSEPAGNGYLWVLYKVLH